MKKILFIIPFLFGCVYNKDISYQCDELYPDYNCYIENNNYYHTGNNVSPYYWGYRRPYPYYYNSNPYYYTNDNHNHHHNETNNTTTTNTVVSPRPNIWSGSNNTDTQRKKPELNQQPRKKTRNSSNSRNN